MLDERTKPNFITFFVKFSANYLKVAKIFPLQILDSWD